MIDTLKSIGIEKGKPFAPSAETKEILESAAREARNWFDMRYESFEKFYASRQWFIPVEPVRFKAFVSGFTDADDYRIDARGLTYYWGFSSLKRVGADQHQLYPFADRDRTESLSTARAHIGSPYLLRYRRSNTGPPPPMTALLTP